MSSLIDETTPNAAVFAQEANLDGDILDTLESAQLHLIKMIEASA
jgi:hypothetical protein